MVPGKKNEFSEQYQHVVWESTYHTHAQLNICVAIQVYEVKRICNSYCLKGFDWSKDFRKDALRNPSNQYFPYIWMNNIDKTNYQG